MSDVLHRHNPPSWAKPAVYLVISTCCLGAILALILGARNLAQIAAGVLMVVAACVWWTWRRTVQSIVMSPEFLVVYRNNGPVDIRWSRISDVNRISCPFPLYGLHQLNIETFSRRSGSCTTLSFVVWTIPRPLADRRPLDNLVTEIRSRAAERQNAARQQAHSQA